MINFKLRKRLLIYPRFQLSLVAVNCAILGMMFAVISFQISSVLNGLNQKGAEISLTPAHPYFIFLQMETRLIHTHLAWGFLLCAILSNAAILILTHQVSGPIVRMLEYFGTISTHGKEAITPLTFRKSDFFGDLPPAVNSAFQKVLTEVEFPKDSP